MTDSDQPKANASSSGAETADGGDAGGEKRRRRRRRRGGGGGAEASGASAAGASDRAQPSTPPAARPERQPRPDRGDRPSPSASSAAPRPRSERSARGERGDRRDRSLQANMPAVAAAVGLAGDVAPIFDDMGMSISPPTESWGIDDEPLTDVALAADLPPDDGNYLVGKVGAVGDVPVRHTARVTFASAGRTMACEAPATAAVAALPLGSQVTVQFERGPRVGILRTDGVRTMQREKPQGTIAGAATPADLAHEQRRLAQMAELLTAAKDIAKQLRLAGKVYRIEGQPGQKLTVYYTCDDRLDMREFAHRYGAKTGARIELRQLGVRDEAKAVGGIGSCGLPLCCTTWLPDFVPVSIKMAKDQGLVLTSNKVSGQCGRLKCCLVYEQAGYTEMRKGLPRLGKRVLTSVGEGRVVEVDVLRQRIRVAYGPGDSQVHPASEVTAKFPSQQGGAGDRSRSQGAPRGDAPANARTRAPSQELASLAHLGELNDTESDDDVDDEPDDDIAATALPADARDDLDADDASHEPEQE